MEDTHILRIVVASPGDVKAERDCLPNVVDELNRGIAALCGLQLKLSRWETDTHPGFHREGPQGLIDPYLEIENCDLLIGIFWKRFGTPAKRSNSGTEHEFKLAYSAWEKKGSPQVFVYFNQKAYTPKNKSETDQWGKVLEFQEKFPKDGLWWGYKGKAEFERLVRQHLTNYLPGLVVPSNAAKTATLTPEPASSRLENYKNYLNGQLNRVQFFDGKSYGLERVFVKPMLSLSLAPSRMQVRANVHSNSTDPPPQRQLLQVDELFNIHRQAVITGGPGAGKSTLLRYLACQALKGPDSFPVFLELKNVTARNFAAAREELVELLFEHTIARPLQLSEAEKTELCAEFHTHLRNGRVVIFLDGLDEVSGTDFFPNLRAAITRFLQSVYGHNRLFVSTRPYAQLSSSDELWQLEIVPFEAEQISNFLRHYQRDTAEVTRLQEVLARHPELRELARVPALLGFIAGLYRVPGSSGQATEWDRLTLYHEIVRLLACTFDEAKQSVARFQVPDRGGNLKLDFLKQLAFARLFAAEDVSVYLFSDELLLAAAQRYCAAKAPTVTPHQLADDVKASALLCQAGHGVYTFIHPSLQEYLAAAALSTEVGWRQSFCRVYFDPVLVESEVLPMFLGLAGPSARPYDLLEQLPESLNFVRLRLQARGLAYGASPAPHHSAWLRDRLSRLLGGYNASDEPYLPAILRSFSGITGQLAQQFSAALAPALRLRNGEGLSLLLESLGSIGEFAHADLPGTASRQRSRRLVMDAEPAPTINKEAEGVEPAPTDTRTVPNLIADLRHLQSDQRLQAANTLGQRRVTAAIPALCQALTDANPFVRQSVVRALGQIGGAQALSQLCRALAHDDDSFVCRRAAAALGSIGGMAAQAALLAALPRADVTMRRTLITALGHSPVAETVPVLLHALDGEAQWEAAQSLNQIDLVTLAEGLLRALSDKHDFVRRKAAEVIAYYADNARALAALQRLTEFEADMAISAAIQQLDYKRQLMNSLVLGHS
ncbi:MAG: HEAT repeat domain-containing protein [Acidobacteria bacterium]|nr:HEAT repeat domain-containing protein [Acidobacteriota bacterium]MBI3427246.1 HEAT repeat domain-containing protein [Acidobacteriota bacterium]